MSDPILPLAVWEEGTLQNDIPANDNALRMEALSRPCLGVANDAAGGDAQGDVWIVGDTPAGAFATFDENDIAIFDGTGWHAWAPVEGLRLVVNDPNLLDEAALTALGSRGVLRIGDGAVQVVVGPIADQLASEIRSQWRAPSTPESVQSSTPAPSTPTGAPADKSVLAGVLAAVGGRSNVVGLHANTTRLVIQVRDAAGVDESALSQLAHAMARPAPTSVHLIVGPGARSWLAVMETLIR